jgi:hypothetical protein
MFPQTTKDICMCSMGAPAATNMCPSNNWEQPNNAFSKAELQPGLSNKNPAWQRATMQTRPAGCTSSPACPAGAFVHDSFRLVEH